jgi:predicted nucleotidyltransferase
MSTKAKSFLLSPGLRDRVDAAVNLMQQLPGFGHVRFIILYGSAAENRMTKESDIDLCIYYDGERMDAARFRHSVLSRLSGTGYDIQIFQHLPLYVRVEVLKGKPVFIRSARFLYDKATETLREFEEFKHRLYDYTGQDAIR